MTDWRWLIGFVIVTALCYVLLRWTAPLAVLHLARAGGHVVDVVAAGFLYPEFLCTSAMRRTSGRAAPFAYVYGDAVCGAALGAHACVEVVSTAAQSVLARLNHVGAAVVSVAVAGLTTCPFLG
ncbi:MULTISPECIES: hypothetical protein [unclassified Streptomyces]|uniref:hypothetical protein n=1 Tax=unclassified Streptomyces TaxID=2593676 RepID=UPI000369E16D|nr:MULTISPECIES: hypothetical protein [unclassified Streptomyces]MYT27909.1 hypothetical protein [Streptomyces sp. SID8354]